MIPAVKEWSRLARLHIVETLRYAYASNANYMQQPEKSYACECKRCDITLYTSTKRLNCEYCGSSDPDVFECKELE